MAAAAADRDAAVLGEREDTTEDLLVHLQTERRTA